MNDTRFTRTGPQPSVHSIEQLRLRFYPDISDADAARILRHLAKRARPLKIKHPRSNSKQGEN
jgi:hypothetical protein